MTTARLPEQVHTGLPSQPDDWLETLRLLVLHHLDDSAYRVQHLARDAGLSARTLNRRLRAVARVRANEFIRNERLRAATDLLQQGLGVAEVAYRVGFENPAYFAHCFKKRFGEVPSRYTVDGLTGPSGFTRFP